METEESAGYSRYGSYEQGRKPKAGKPSGRWFPEGFLLGGAERDRTADLVNAIHALSQLSYGPTSKRKFNYRR